MTELEKTPTQPGAEINKKEIKKKLNVLLEKLSHLQNLLYAENKHSVLIVLQGMDASGKDGLIRKVLGSMNPQGVNVQSFKVPTEEELAHDFLWRIHKHAPAKGMIQVFNRSYYEDVLVTRVHEIIGEDEARKRMAAIVHFESLLREHNSCTLLKFYLHVSEEEQTKRIAERLENREKMWKYNPADKKEAQFWKEYRKYYESVFQNSGEIPWHIIPSDKNWYKCFLVAEILVQALEDLNMKFPKTEYKKE